MSTILREGHFDDGAQLQAAKAAVSHTAFFNLLEGDGSAGALEHHRPSKVSSRNEVKDTDRSSPYWRMPYYVDNDILTYIPIWHYN